MKNKPKLGLRKSSKDRIRKLVDTLNKYSYEYHVLDEPIVDDAVYDGLMAELKQLESEYPDLILPESPDQRVGGVPLDSFTKIEHKNRMLSINDVFSKQEVDGWLKRITKLDESVKNADFWVDIKMDGLSCSLVYQDGLLDYAATRGDGFVGEDITQNVRTINTVPIKLIENAKNTTFLDGRTEIRGEIVMYKRDFEKLNKSLEESGEKVYANPRNLAAGTMRQLDPSVVASRKLYFRPFDLIRDTVADTPTVEYIYDALKVLGFVVNKESKVLNTPNQIIEYANQWQEKRHNLPFNTDGLVIKINNRALYTKLGVVGKNPRGAIAFKYPAETTTTKLKDIFISIGRTGAATPVAVLEPVNVAGSTVQMATLHNDDEIKRKDILIGDTVVIQKAGDIIPEVVEPIVSLRNGGEKPFVMPKNCPDCDTAFVKPEGEVVWRCPNNNCPARTWRHIQHYASKPALNIDGLGEKNVQALLDAGIIKDAADLYTLKVADLVKLERFAELSAKNLVKAINNKKNPPLAKFLFALGIRHVGAQTAVDLANRFKSLDAIKAQSVEELNNVDGIGEVVAESIVTWFADTDNQALLYKFAKNGVKIQTVQDVQEGRLKGKSFVITGSLSGMGREQAADKVRELGGTFQSSVSKGTTYLVGAGKVGASKLAKAEKYGTKIIDETKFLEIIS